MRMRLDLPVRFARIPGRSLLLLMSKRAATSRSATARRPSLAPLGVPQARVDAEQQDHLRCHPAPAALPILDQLQLGAVPVDQLGVVPAAT